MTVRLHEARLSPRRYNKQTPTLRQLPHHFQGLRPSKSSKLFLQVNAPIRYFLLQTVWVYSNFYVHLFVFFFGVGELFIPSVKHTYSERTTRAMFTYTLFSENR